MDVVSVPGDSSGQAPDGPRLTDGQRAVLALCMAALKVRDGMWIKGAPTHLFAELLIELEGIGWSVVEESAEPSPGRVEAGARALTDDVLRKATEAVDLAYDEDGRATSKGIAASVLFALGYVRAAAAVEGGDAK